MDEQNPRVGGERIGGRSDERVTGRETPGAPGSTEEYRAPRATRRKAGTTETARGYAATTPAGESDEDTEIRTAEIRAEIEETRGQMSETVNEIQDRLRPSTIASNAAESVRSTVSETTRDIAESESVQYVRANPVPTAMVGIGLAGLAWLAFGGREARPGRRYERERRDWRVPPAYSDEQDYYRATGSTYRGTGSSYRPGESYETAGAYSPGLSYGRDRERHVTDEVRERARQTTRRAQSQLQRTWNESPLLIGAASAVLGALVGMAVPETERENELMGETRDSVLEGVQQTVKEKVSDVQNAATKAVTDVQKAVGITPETGTGETKL